MPQIQILPAGRRSASQSIAQGLGEGLAQGMADLSKASLSDKMEQLKIQRAQQAEAQKKETFAKTLEDQGMEQLAPLARAGFTHDNLLNMLKEGIDPRSLMQGGKQGGQGGYQQNLQQLGGQGYQPNIGPQNIPFGYENQLQPGQDTGGMQSIPGKEPTMKPPPQAPPKEPELTTLDDYRKRIAPNYDELGNTAKARVSKQAKDEFDSDMKLKEAEAKKSKEEQTIPKKRLEAEFTRIDKGRADIYKKEMSLALLEDAFSKGNMGFFSLNNLAEITKINGLRDPAGAEFKAAVKEFYLSTLGRAGTRPNQWIEQQLMQLLPHIGQSQEANEAMMKILQMDLNLDTEEMKILDQLDDEYPNDPRKVLKEKNNRLKEYSDYQQKEFEYGLKKSYSDKLNPVAPGTPFTNDIVDLLLKKHNFNEEEAMKEGIELGYKL